MKKKMTYVEPADYFPKEIRQKYGLGEFNDEVNDEIRKSFGLETKKTKKVKKTTAKKTSKKK